MKSSLIISSPAKLNLFLDVLGRRPDGYHELETLFERISLSDTLKLEKILSNTIRFSTNSSFIPSDRTNLVYQAAALMKKASGLKQGVAVELDKRIPVGAGLAGGSSNAAATLLGMNRLFKLNMKKSDLLDFANQLGSDVAFFILNRSFALGRGRGGDLKSVQVPKKLKLWHILIVPCTQVLSKDVYFLLDQEKKLPKMSKNPQKSLTLTKKLYDVNILISKLKSGNSKEISRSFYNRLTPTVIKSYSFVSKLMDQLHNFGLQDVDMSGSGPSLFVTYESQKRASEVLKMLVPFSDRCKLFMVSTL